MKNTYQDIKDLKLANCAGNSTISGWKKSGKHPAWVDAIRTQQHTIDKLLSENKTLRDYIKIAH